MTDRYLVLINPTDVGRDYTFHQGWFPRYLNAQLIFFSDGQRQGVGGRVECGQAHRGEGFRAPVRAGGAEAKTELGI